MAEDIMRSNANIFLPDLLGPSDNDVPQFSDEFPSPAPRGLSPSFEEADPDVPPSRQPPMSNASQPPSNPQTQQRLTNVEASPAMDQRRPMLQSPQHTGQNQSMFGMCGMSNSAASSAGSFATAGTPPEVMRGASASTMPIGYSGTMQGPPISPFGGMMFHPGEGSWYTGTPQQWVPQQSWLGPQQQQQPSQLQHMHSVWNAHSWSGPTQRSLTSGGLPRHQVEIGMRKELAGLKAAQNIEPTAVRAEMIARLEIELQYM